MTWKFSLAWVRMMSEMPVSRTLSCRREGQTMPVLSHCHLDFTCQRDSRSDRNLSLQARTRITCRTGETYKSRIQSQNR